MNEVLLIVSMLTIVIMLILGWLLVENYKLKKSLKAVRYYLEQNNKDMAGLCSAAVVVDNKILENREKLAAVLAKLADIERAEETKRVDRQTFDQSFEEQEPFVEKEENDAHVQHVIDEPYESDEEQQSQPYYNAIQQVRDGATEEELIQQFGLSRDEAVLLMRLHG